MKAIADALRAHLETGATTLCWCWILKPQSGRAMGFTDHDRDLALEGVVCEAAAGCNRTESQASLGLSVDNLDISGVLRSDHLSERDLAAGVFDNALVEMWLVNWNDPDQRMMMRCGNLGEITRGAHGFSAEIRGISHQLNQPTGRLYCYGCDARLGDRRCGVNLHDPLYSTAGVVRDVKDLHRLSVGGLETFADGWFARGRIGWTSGANKGRAMEIKAHQAMVSATIVRLWQAMSEPVRPGDRFIVTAGCDKQFATCRAKFDNAVNFRGFPQMPGNDYAISHPHRDDPDNDGASRSAHRAW
ncbi:MAG: DUF2163 domain-containing protein [Hyphomicrobiales bacterium]